MVRVLVVATSRKTRGGITAVIKQHEKGEQWKKYHCVWIQTHRDGDHSAKMIPPVSLKWYRFVSVVTGIAFHVVGDTCLKSDSHVVIKLHEPWRWHRVLRCQAITKSTRLSLSSLTHRRSFQFDKITAVYQSVHDGISQRCFRNVVIPFIDR